MQIHKILGNTNLSFGRKLTPEEEKDYKENAIKPALNYLGTKEVAMILHGTSFPESANDIGVGSPYGKVAAQLIPFELLHGFNSIQLGPVGELASHNEISPYKSAVGVKNTLFIDVDKLTEDDYANILSPEIVKQVTNIAKQNDKNYSYANYADAFANQDYLLNIAYKNYKSRVSNKNDFKIQRLNKEYKDFKQQNKDIWHYGLFNIISKSYGTEDFTKWDEQDKNLIFGIKNNDVNAVKRLEKILIRSGNELEKYNFGQFLLNKQIQQNTKFRQGSGFKYISDMLVGFSPSDEWSHQDLFLSNYRMGCPYGGFDGGIQRWNVPVLDPKKLFNTDGTLGAAGEYLKVKLKDALTNFDNVRIDHALGLVDPFIYAKNGTRQGNISGMPDIDPDKSYLRIIDEIVLPVLDECGIDKNTPVWEDLGTATPAFEQIYHQKHNLAGITALEYQKAENMSNAENWALVGSHDKDPAIKMVKKDWIRKNEAWNPLYLAGVLNAASSSSEYCNKIAANEMEMVKAKFAELFMMCPKVQISFADFFGIDKTYNEGGNDLNPNNWKLRLSNNYEQNYYDNLASENPSALNIPEILQLAIKGKSDMDIVKNQITQEETDAKILPILNKLAKYEKILKE